MARAVEANGKAAASSKKKQVATATKDAADKKKAKSTASTVAAPKFKEKASSTTSGKKVKATAAKATAKGKASAKSKPQPKAAEIEEDEKDEDDEDEEEEQAGRNARKTVLKSLADAGIDQDEGDSEAEDEEDDEGVGRDAPIFDVVKLPSRKDEKTVKARLDAVEKKNKGKKPDKRGVLYIGRIPKGFYEDEMRSYFSQFGTVTRLRLSRNKKTGAPKHYAFIEFEDEEVAEIVQETMDNYLINGHLMQVKTVSRDKVHPDLFKGANRKWRKMPNDRRERVLHDQPRSKEEQKKVEQRLLKRQSQRIKSLKEKGIDYEFEGYQLKK